jgi:hypothetical protein
MKKVILHIGRHKSGTSSLQGFLHTNSDILKEMGVLYPNTGRGKQVAHHRLASFLERPECDSKEYQQLKAQLKLEASNFDSIIISSEGFQNCKDLDGLRDFFGDYHLHVVVYFREILDYLQSAYAQSVQNTNESRDFELYAEQTKLNYQAFYNRWAEIADSISAHYFHRSALKNQDIIDDFLSISGLDLQKSKSEFKQLEGEANPSIGGNLLYFKLHYNRLGYHTDAPLYRRLSNIATTNKPLFANGFFISDSLATKLRELYHDNNQFLSNRCAALVMRDFTDKPNCPNTATLDEDLETIIQLIPEKKLLLSQFIDEKVK